MRLVAAGQAVPVSAEQMELARLRAELVRVKMKRDIFKKATAYFVRHKSCWPVTLSCEVLSVSASAYFNC